ncbi:hypothetical protein BD408DRAFT_430507 [Parasitella parasitica]|nr:hypothetical protein BD408DRAFT_430507 [Parasitella parasitica]
MSATETIEMTIFKKKLESPSSSKINFPISEPGVNNQQQQQQQQQNHTNQLQTFEKKVPTMLARYCFLLGLGMAIRVHKGWMIALSTSTTVSSNAIMTRNANRNDGAAKYRFESANVTMCLYVWFQNGPIVLEPGANQENPDCVGVLNTLGSIVLAPLVVGQIIPYLFPVRGKVFSSKFDSVASDPSSKKSGVHIVATIFVDIFM